MESWNDGRQSDNGVEPTAVTVEPLQLFTARLSSGAGTRQARGPVKAVYLFAWRRHAPAWALERVALIAVICG